MPKAIFTYSIEAEVGSTFQVKFPRQASKLIEGYMRDLLAASIQAEEFDTKEKTQAEMQRLASEINKMRANLKVLEVQYTEQQERDQDKEQERLADIEAEARNFQNMARDFDGQN